MIDSVVLINRDFISVIEDYLCISEGEKMEKDGDILIDNLLFEKNDGWTIITDLEGEVFSETFLLEFSKGEKLIYYYSDDSQLDCEFLVIENNSIIRKKYIYASTPELDEDEGRLKCENRDFVKWNDVDYLVEIIHNNPNSLFN